MPEQDTPHKVVVIGGGYAGTLAANRLRRRADVDISKDERSRWYVAAP